MEETYCSDGDAIFITYSVEWQILGVSCEHSTFNRLGPSNDPGILIRWEWWPRMTGLRGRRALFPKLERLEGCLWHDRYSNLCTTEYVLDTYREKRTRIITTNTERLHNDVAGWTRCAKLINRRSCLARCGNRCRYEWGMSRPAVGGNRLSLRLERTPEARTYKIDYRL